MAPHWISSATGEDLMAKKKAETPKLDATVKNLENRIKLTIPEYTKPQGSLNHVAAIGLHVIVRKRTLNTGGGAYELREIEGTIAEMGEHFVRIVSKEDGRVTIPWWSIHDWETLEVEEGEGASV
jgi:hypothetical protein